MTLRASLGKDVATHKAMFFRENDSLGNRIDYQEAVTGSIQIVPEAGAFESLRADYSAMLEDGLPSSHQPSFEEVMRVCQILQDNINTTQSDW